MEVSEKLIERINNTIRDVHDFPKKGIVFKDITPILKDANLSKTIINQLAANLPDQVTHVAGIESRGFLFGFPCAVSKNIFNNMCRAPMFQIGCARSICKIDY